MRPERSFVSAMLVFAIGLAWVAVPTSRAQVSDANPSVASEDVGSGEEPSFVPSEDILRMRDPFKKPEIQASQNTTPTSELERYSTESFKMIGVLTGPDRIRAMLLAPDGKTFIVSEKMKIGLKKGLIKKISVNKVVIREKTVNVFGQTENLDSEISLQSEGQKAPTPKVRSTVSAEAPIQIPEASQNPLDQGTGLLPGANSAQPPGGLRLSPSTSHAGPDEGAETLGGAETNPEVKR